MKKIFHMHGGASRTCLKPKKERRKIYIVGNAHVSEIFKWRKNKIVEELI